MLEGVVELSVGRANEEMKCRCNEAPQLKRAGWKQLIDQRQAEERRKPIHRPHTYTQTDRGAEWETSSHHN